MRLFLICVSMLLAMAGVLRAEGDSPLRMLITGADSRGWEAVGRLNINDEAMCTGALIAPDIVLTAAHCLFDMETGKRYPASRIEFLAGWRNGRARAQVRALNAAILPEYVYDPHQPVSLVQKDIALLRLVRPIRNTAIKPFDLAERPGKWDQVEVVSYARDRAQSPSLQERCHVLARQSGTLMLSCDVDFGSSGAPVFVEKDGRPHVVSVISAKAQLGSKKVALAAAVKRQIDTLMKSLDEAPAAANGLPVVRRLGNPVMRSSGGAKFMRP